MPDGSRAYVNAENDGGVVLVDAVKQKMIEAIPLGKPGVIKPMAVLLSPDATQALRQHRPRTAGLHHRHGHQQSRWLRRGGTRARGASRFRPMERRLYSANGPSNDISVVDLATNTVTQRIKAGTGPWGVIALDPK